MSAMNFCVEIFFGSAAATASDGHELPGQLSGAWLWAVMLVPPVILWTALAVRRAWQEDTTREQRVARRDLEGLLGGVVKRSGYGGQPTKAELKAWCNAVVRLWKIDGAAPSEEEVAAQGGEGLGKLWAEAEEAMYSARGVLPADWMVRAIAAVGGVVVPSAPWPVPRLRRHWLPVVAGMAVAVMVAGSMVPRVDAAEAVRQDAGKVLPAKSATMGATKQKEEKSGLMAAQAAAAYLQRPRDAVVREGLRQGLAKVEGADAGLVRLLDGAWYDRGVGRMTPREWARVARVAALLAAMGFSAAVVGIYFGRGRGRRGRMGGGLVVGAFAAMVAAGAWGAWLRYGVLADARVAMIVAPAELKMIPSEIGVRQPGANLVTGTLVVVDQSFLGWDHVVVRERAATAGKGAQAAVGWVRAEHVAWLYQERDYAEVSAVYAGAER